MSLNSRVDFVFTNYQFKLNYSLTYLLQKKESLKLIIKNGCDSDLNMTVFEDNIILVDFDTNILINTVQDLIENKTKKCKIIIKPISY